MNVKEHRSTMTGQQLNQADIELKCKYGKVYTHIWRCDDGGIIPSDLVCDTNPTCDDESDETTELCSGVETASMRVFKYGILSKYVAGFLVFALFLSASELLPEGTYYEC